jgi:hypothetical protein
MQPLTPGSEFADAIHRVTLARLRRRSPRLGRWLLLAVLVVIILTAAWNLVS